MLKSWNTQIRIPGGQRINVQIRIKDVKGDSIDPKGLSGKAIIGQGNDRREDYKELKLGSHGDLFLVYFPPMDPGEYRMKLILKKGTQLLHLQELKVIVTGTHTVNPSSRNFGVTIEGYI